MLLRGKEGPFTDLEVRVLVSGCRFGFSEVGLVFFCLIV